MSGCYRNTGVGITNVPTDVDGNVPISVQDYTGEGFSFFLTQELANTTLTNNASKGDLTINVTNATGCIVFDAINIYDNESYFQSLILSTTATSITMNSELDNDFDISNTYVECAEWDLSTSDGSITPEFFKISPPTNRTWHIVSTAINILDDSPMDDSRFGGGPALTNGISGRVTDGYSKDLFLIYNNNGFFLRGFDKSYQDKAPAGLYGLNAILFLRDVYGIVVELDGSTRDVWEAVNRDDLTTQEEIGITVNGHYVTNNR